MGNLISYGRVRTSKDPVQNYILYDPKALSPFDRLQVVLEQYLYASYFLALGMKDTAEELYNAADKAYIGMPSRLTTQTVDGRLYAFAIDQVKILRSRHFANVNIDTLLAIFSEKHSEYHNREYTATITPEFLIEIVSFLNGKIPTRNSGEKTIPNASLYIPCMHVELNYNPAVYKDKNKDYLVIVDFEPHESTKFYLNPIPFGKEAGLADFINRFDFGDLAVDDLVPLLAAFSTNHSQYDMTSFTSLSRKIEMEDVCYDLVTGNSFVPRAGSSVSPNVHHFMEVFKEMIETHRLQNIKESALFGEILQKIGESTDLVNYFMKPVNLITASEAYAFRSSFYKDFIKDKALGSMEDLDTNKVNSNQNNDSQDTKQAGSPAGDDQQDTNASSDTSSKSTDKSDKESDKIVDHKPEVDPKLMLLELASPVETMSDYLFRETISRRISNTLRNPPENARPDQLLLIKRLKSRWLYLISISCLRDFLMKLPLRLSDA